MLGLSQVEIDEDPVEAKETDKDEKIEVITLFYCTFFVLLPTD